MEEVGGTYGRKSWEYANKDGTRDKRRKSNREKAAWFGAFKCNSCGATTLTSHYTDWNPSAYNIIWKWELKKASKGFGKRTASNHDSTKEW